MSKINSIEIRKDFPMYQNHPNLCYLDTGATSLKPKCVIDAMNDYYFNYGVNVHRGVYNLSYLATDKYEQARQTIANFINAKFEEVIFTKNVSQALNLFSLCYKDYLQEGDEIITSELEHHSSVLPWLMRSKEKKLALKYIELDKEGRISVEAFKKVLTNKTKVVALTLVSNVMGYITPIEEIIKLSHEVGAIVIVDAAQAVCHFKLDVKSLDCDVLAFSGHKMLGPTGIGVMYAKKKLLKMLSPLEYGGDMNDEVSKYDVTVKESPYGFETGTPMIAEAIGLARSVQYLESIGFENILDHEKLLHEYALNKLSEVEGITIYNKTAECAIISFNVDGVHPHDAATFFDENEICLRAGHHCAQLITKWLNVPGTLRASFYIYNNYEDVDRFVETVKSVVEFFKKF